MSMLHSHKITFTEKYHNDVFDIHIYISLYTHIMGNLLQETTVDKKPYIKNISRSKNMLMQGEMCTAFSHNKLCLNSRQVIC